MKITEKPYPKAKKVAKPRNLWCINFEWMYGDADGEVVSNYTYDTEAEFLKAYNRLKSILDFEEYDHNSMVDLAGRGTTLAEFKKNEYGYFNQETIDRVEKLLDGCQSLSEVIQRDVGDVERDITCGGDCLAHPESINEMFRYDKAGNKLKLTITK